MIEWCYNHYNNITDINMCYSMACENVFLETIDWLCDHYTLDVNPGFESFCCSGNLFSIINFYNKHKKSIEKKRVNTSLLHIKDWIMTDEKN